MGSAQLYKNRVFEHMSETTTSKHFQNSIAKYGKLGFKLLILFDFGCEVKNKDIRFAKEQVFLDIIPIRYYLTSVLTPGEEVSCEEKQGIAVWVTEKGFQRN